MPLAAWRQSSQTSLYGAQRSQKARWRSPSDPSNDAPVVRPYARHGGKSGTRFAREHAFSCHFSLRARPLPLKKSESEVRPLPIAPLTVRGPTSSLFPARCRSVKYKAVLRLSPTVETQAFLPLPASQGRRKRLRSSSPNFNLFHPNFAT